jgi:hypothetical protein
MLSTRFDLDNYFSFPMQAFQKRKYVKDRLFYKSSRHRKLIPTFEIKTLIMAEDQIADGEKKRGRPKGPPKPPKERKSLGRPKGSGGPKPTHPPFAILVVKAVTELNEKKGSSKIAIVKYVMAEVPELTDKDKVSKSVKTALKRAVEQKTLVAPKGTIGKFKLSDKAPKAKKVKKAKTPSKVKKVKSPKKVKASPKKVKKVTPKKKAPPKKNSRRTQEEIK